MNSTKKRSLFTGAIVAAGLILASASFAFAADTTPPTAPSGLGATGVSISQINLSWTGSTDDTGVAGYGVFRDGLQVGTTSATTFADTGLAAGTTHSYAVDAFDAANNLSVLSASASGSTLADTSAPSVPTGLSATAVSSSQVNLSWSASSDNVAVTGYNIYRNGIKIATTAATSFSDTGLGASTTYTYTVAAFDAHTNTSAQSTSASATTLASTSTDTTAPSVPAGLSASAASASQINLSWSASTDSVGVTGYKVYRNGVQVGTTGTVSYSDSGLAASTGYNYTVAAYDAAGNTSGQSSTASATTLASGTVTPPSAVSVPPTVDIDSNGNITVHDLIVTSVGTNTFTGTVWGITYTVNYNGSVTSGNGKGRFQFFLKNGNSSTINASQIQVGDVLGVQGQVTKASPLVIAAQVVRNYSITNPRTPPHAGNGNQGNGNNGNNGNNDNNSQTLINLQALLQQLLGRFHSLGGR